MKKIIYIILTVMPLLGVAAVPMLNPYSGKITNKTGETLPPEGYFKFAVVNSACQNPENTEGCQILWSSSNYVGDLVSGQPDTGIRVDLVENGKFSINLGDVNMVGMNALDPGVFNTGDLYLRIWFTEVQSGQFERFAPDRRIVSVPFAIKAQESEQAQVAVFAQTVNENNAVTKINNVGGPVEIKAGPNLTVTSGTEGNLNTITLDTAQTIPTSIVSTVNGISNGVNISAGRDISVSNGGNSITIATNKPIPDPGAITRTQFAVVAATPSKNSLGSLTINTPSSGRVILYASGYSNKCDNVAEILVAHTGDANRSYKFPADGFDQRVISVTTQYVVNSGNQTFSLSTACYGTDGFWDATSGVVLDSLFAYFVPN